jgi:anti-anti-sigma factor
VPDSVQPVLAHLGHWYVGGPVFLAPVVLLILAIKANEWREKRRAGDGPARVETTFHEDRAMVAIAGRLDLPTVSQLGAELAIVAARRIPLAVLDLRETISIEEVVIARLVELQDDSRRAGVEWALVAATPGVQVPLEMSGLTDLVAVLESPGSLSSGAASRGDGSRVASERRNVPDQWQPLEPASRMRPSRARRKRQR